MNHSTHRSRNNDLPATPSASAIASSGLECVSGREGQVPALLIDHVYTFGACLAPMPKETPVIISVQQHSNDDCSCRLTSLPPQFFPETHLHIQVLDAAFGLFSLSVSPFPWHPDVYRFLPT
jgi:hypothetical protein